MVFRTARRLVGTACHGRLDDRSGVAMRVTSSGSVQARRAAPVGQLREAGGDRIAVGQVVGALEVVR